MIHDPEASDHDVPLADLVALRAALRREHLRLSAALCCVQRELRDWLPERQSRGSRAPQHLRILWAELEERERELALDLLAVEARRKDVDLRVLRHLHAPPMAG